MQVGDVTRNDVLRNSSSANVSCVGIILWRGGVVVKVRLGWLCVIRYFLCIAFLSPYELVSFCGGHVEGEVMLGVCVVKYFLCA